MNQGKIIEYIDQGKFICTLCLNDKINRLHLLTTSNREVNLSPKRAILISSTIIDTLKPREELLEKLKHTEETRSSLKAQIDVKELWELVRDEEESFDHKYLAQLVFGHTITDDHLSALVRALFEDHLHFKMKDGNVTSIYPLVAWKPSEDNIKSYVTNHNLLPYGSNPLVSNSDLVSVMTAVDILNLGYSSFEPEFAQLIREGKADRNLWLPIFEICEHTVNAGNIPKEVPLTLSRLGLTLKDVT